MNTRYLVSILVLLNVAAAPAVHSHTDSEHVAWVLEPRQISVKSSTAEAVELRDEVAIIELVGDYDRALADGAQNLEPRTAIGHEFYSLLEDDYDFLVAFSTFAFDAGPARAFAWGIQNSDSGIGLPIFDSSELFGSGGRLQSFIDMGELASHVTDPLDPAFEDTLVILAHEIMHRWGVHVHFRLPDGTSSDALLGLEGSHWSFLADTGASVMYGNDWRDEGDGSFTSTGVLKFFSPLDLYLAGLYSPDEVPPFFVIDDSGEDPTRLPHLGAQISGTRRAVTVEDIIAAEGPRVPAVGEAPNEFRLAFLLITRPGDVVTPAMLDGINRVRREFQIRFSALTGGRALVDVYPPVVADGDPGSPSGVDGGDLRPDAVLEDGLAWLRGRQSPEGYWEDRPATRVRDTTLAVATLASLDPLFSGFDEAITWLEAQPGPSTDTLARLAISLDGVTASVASLRSTLVERRNPDGGWGVAPGYASDPLDSALAIQALAGYDDSVVESGVTYLLAAQNADGGWPVHAGGASRTSVTTAVVRAFESAGRQAELPSSTFAWLAGQQNPDGGFGDSPSTVHDTANTLEALSSVSGLSFVDGSAASSFLTARQTVDGSWDGSVYGTSLALSAIKRFTFPNLALVGQPTVDPSAPRDGERVRLTYEVLNDGRLTAANSVLRLYEGDPALGGTAVGEVALPAIASGQSVHATLLWDSLDRAGTQLLVAVLDPEDVLTELSELDNRIQTEIQVQAAPEEPDLEIAAEEISFSPASPSELPQLLGITAVVRNLGQTDASDVLVRLYLGEAEDAVLAGETTISVPQRSSSPANFSYLLENPGTTWFTVVVDPEDVSSEADESNNSASVAVSTTGTVDLEVTPSDVTLLGSPFSGNDLTFRVALRNRGTLDSPDSVVRYTVTDGTTVRDLGTATVQIPAGGSVERDVVWRVDLLGDLEFRAEIDGDDLVPEADEDNNLAVVPFVATEVTGADLVLTRGDLSFDPNPGLEGASLTFTAALRNTGGEAVANAEVGFYDGDPGHGGTLLGTAVVPSIGPGETVDAVFVESRVESAADRLIFAVADPNGLVAEFGEDNNATFELLEVSSLPDPAVGVASLELTPRFPQPGQNVTLTVRVANLGEQGVTGLVVRALDNGVAVGGDQVIEVPGAGEATAVFAWDVGVADSESRSVSVVLDPDDIVEEGSEANNQASIPLSVQDGDFFVTHRFFSPNGDGVQDETDLFFRLEAPTPVAIEVVDSQRQNVVRRSDFGNVSAGQFTWDGRDDFGRLVRDADYELRLVATATDAVLDQALVSLDTDRVSLLRAGGTGFETFTNLTCELPTVADVSETIDEQWTFFSVIGSVDSAYPSGVWRMRTDGTGLQQVVGPGFLGNRSVFNLTVSPDGSRIAFVTSRELWVGRGDGSALVELVNPGSATRSDLPVGFDSNGTTLIAERISGGSGLVLWQVDGSGDSAILTTDRTDDHRMSADGRYLLYFDRDTDAARVLDVDSGDVLALPYTGRFGNGYSFSPSGDRLAFADVDADRISVLAADGSILRVFDLPIEAPPSIYDDFVGGADGGPISDNDPSSKNGPVSNQPTRIGDPSWALSETELAVRVVYGDSCHGLEYARLLRLDVVSGEIETVGFTEPIDNCHTYRVSTWNGSSWAERGQLHLGLRYREGELDLSEFLPDADGEYKVRIRQTGHEAAHVESVALGVYGADQQPVEAFRLDGDDVLAEVVAFDGEVVDLHEKTLQARWQSLPLDAEIVLRLVAREETLSGRDARPLSYPKNEDGSFGFVVEAGPPMQVDGLQTAADGLEEPLFRQFSDPDTGHPSAVVAGYAASDGNDLFAALDFTVDNTLDDGEDWAELAVLTASGWRSFRVTTEDSTWGRVGFTRTGHVHHRHKYYEFRIPLTELGLEAGEATELRFAAYGTAATLPDSELLPAFGTVLWDPADRALLYAAEDFGETSYAIFFDEDDRREPIFGEWNDFRGERFSTSGRRLLFTSSDQRNDPQSACYLRGTTDLWSYRSLLNLTVDLRPRRSATLSGFLLEGTAADLNFDRWELHYADTSQPDVWRAILPPSEQPVIDERLTTWVPPGAGSYLVRLSAFDLAGNRRERIQQVVSSDQPTITDLSIAPRLFSPNGDGVLDATIVHYRVLQPVHLDFRFFNEDGERVRTIQRDHAEIGAEFDLAWDGRDDLGLPLRDGEYRMVVQNYEFFVTLDSTPPVVLITLDEPGRCDSEASGEIPELSYQIWETHFDPNAGFGVETGEGASPATWTPFSMPAPRPPTEPQVGDPDFRGGRLLSYVEYVDHRFRFDVEDLAGNRSVLSTELGSEELVLSSFGRLEIDEETGLLQPIPRFDCNARNLVLEPGPARFRVRETVIPQMFEMFVEVQPAPVVDGQIRLDLVNPAGWFPQAVTVFDPPGSPIPDHGMTFDWDMAGVAPEGVTAVRLRAVDAQGGVHLSDLFSVTTEGTIIFHGLMAHQGSPGTDGLIEELRAGVPPEEQEYLELWGQEFVGEPLAKATLFLWSEDDPRYAVPQAIPATALVEGGFLFTAFDWQACLSYTGFVQAVTEPSLDPQTGEIVTLTLTSAEAGFRFPCLSVGVAMDDLEIGACDAPAPTLQRRVTMTPRSLDGADLQLLTLEGPDETGQSEVLFSVNNPPSGVEQSFSFDTTDIPAGIYPLSVRLTNVNGQETTSRGYLREGDRTTIAGPVLVVDRTPPSRAEITYPADGQRVCAVRQGDSSVIEIEGVVEDDLAVVFALDIGDGTSPSHWTPVGGSLGVDATGGHITDAYLLSSDGATSPPTRTAGVVGAMADRSGVFSARLRAADNGGAQICSEPVTFDFDGQMDGATATTNVDLISPNGDDFLESVVVQLGVAESATVDAIVWPAIYSDELDTCLLDEPDQPVRTLFSGLPLFDVGQAEWDGRDDGGSVVADGWYRIVVDFTDGCGNPTRIGRCVEVDNTPPGLEVLYPASTDPVTQIVEVVGSVQDPHLQSWSVDFGIGSDPLTWARIADGDDLRMAEILGVWNTFGLEGDHTLRLRGVDAAGNVAEERVPLFLSNPHELLTYLEALPRPFSPNGDSRRDALSIRFGLGSQALVHVTVVDLADLPLRTLLTDADRTAGAHVVEWDGLTDAGVPAPDGDYRAVVTARLASNTLVVQTEQVTASLDATPPTLAFVRPADSSFAPSEGPIQISVQDASLRDYSLSLAEEPLNPPWLDLATGTEGGDELVVGTLTDLEEGAYALRLVANDEGESHSELLAVFVIDDTPPVVTLTEPVDGSFWNGGEPVGVVGSIEEENLTGWVLEIGAGTEPDVWTELAAGAEVPMPEPLFAWDLGGAADGIYTLRLTADDQAGHSVSAAATIQVDQTLPVVAISSPAADGYVTSPGAISGTAADDHLVRYEVAVAPGPPGTSEAFSPLGESSTSVVDGRLADWVSLPPDGSYTLRVLAQDAAANVAEVRIGVTIDTQPPSPPVGLTTTVESETNVRLEWQSNTEPDVVGYHVWRDGVLQTSEPVSSTTYVDAALTDALYTYTVTAVDRAGLESEPSAPTTARIDRTPPSAALHLPSDGDRVGGLVDILGTAHSADDFREYRLDVESAGGSVQALRTSPVPVLSDVLAQWNTSTLPDESTHTLRLEAEDLAGNVALATATVVVDNQPPSAPTGLVATVTGSDVALSWTAGADPDLAGYLLYRDGVLANAVGAVIGSLEPYVLTSTSFADDGRPDGTSIYEVYAIDEAGNLSGPSTPAEATVETRAPSAVIVQPEDGAAFEGDLYVLAVSDDSDIERVLFQQRAAGATVWTDIASAVDDAPWEIDWDPGAQALPFGDYELRAVATDFGGSSDPAPVVTTVIFTDLTRPAAVSGLSALVDGGDVTLSWQPNATDSDLEGYHVDRVAENSTPVRLTVDPITVTSYTDVGLVDRRYSYTVVAVDGVGNESDPSGEAAVEIYTPGLVQPYTPTTETAVDVLGFEARAGATAEATVTLGGSSVPLTPVTVQEDGGFVLTAAPLSAGESTIQVSVVDGDGNRSKSASVRVVVGIPPSAPTGLAAVPAGGFDVALSWDPNPEPDVIAYRILRDGLPLPPAVAMADATALASSESGVAMGAVLAIDGNPFSCWSPHSNQPLPGQWLEVSWPERRLIPRVQVDWRIGEDENDQPVSESMASWDLEAWDGAVWVPLFSMRGNDDPEVTVALEPGYLTDRMRLRLAEGAVSGCLAELAVVHHPLVAGTSGLDSTTDGTYEYQVIALDDRGFESMPSDVATLDVGDVEPPEPVVLSAVVSGSDVSLTWTASTSPDVDHYDLFRDGDRIAQHSDLGNLALVDANLANGTYGYTLVVVDQVGNASEPSNEASAIVAVAPPPAPTSLTVSAPQIGGALDLVWNAVAGDPVAGYRVARSTSAGGPYTAVATTPDLVLRDEGLTNGVTYFYVVHALDVVGNASPPSNEASGTPSDALPPAAPVFLAPAPSGSSVTTTLPQVLVAGLAEPGTSVEVTRDGRPLPSVVALASEQRVEVSGLPFEVVPRLSSYGRRAWLEASGDHWLVDFNTGSALEVDLPEAEQVRWLPDASGIVYVGGDETELRRRTLDGIETVLGTAEFLAAGALPSPDGKSYAVIAERGDFGLWLLDAVDETWTLLFEDSELVSSSLAFSPDGTQLAYQRGESSTVGVWVIELATGVETFVFDDAWSGIPPRWSPSGNRLLFATSEGGQQLWTWSLADGDVTAVSEVLFGLSDVVFGPEGSAVVYAVEDDGIFRLPLEGGETELLEEAFGEPRLDRASTGDLLLAHGGDAIRLRPAGSFQLPGVLLEAGDNLFAATSFDQAGNASSAADPITVTLEGGGLPDLALDASELTVFPAVPRLGETAQLSVVVRNLGSVAAPSGDLALVLIAADGSVATLPTGAVPALAPGSSIAVTVDHLFAGEPGLYRLTAAVDPLQQIVETSDDNNQVEIGFAVARDGQPLVTVTTDREQYLADQDVFAEVSLYNFDGPLTDRLVVSVEDEQGFEVVQLADEAIVDLQYGDSRTLAVTWNTGTTFAGEYRIAARLLDGSAEAFAPFTLAEASTLAAVVTTDRAAYPSGALVQISGVVEYVAGNTALQNLSTRLRVADFEGVVTAEWLQSLGDLLPENSYAVAAVWESSAASSGTYSVELDVLREEEVVATASTSFLLDEAGLDVTGSLIAADAAPAVGFPLELTFTLTNSGTVPLSEVPVTVSLREPADGAVLAEVPTVMDLPVASSAEGSASFDTTPLGLGTFVVILEAELPAGSDATTVTLDTLAVSTVDRTPPQVTLVTPEEGATLGADALVEAIVQDALSRVDAVELSLDGGLWLAMSPADEATGSYRHALDGISAGSHTLAVRARDAADNQSESVEVRFEVSLLPLLTATKVDAMSTDADGDGSPSPGDTLRYTITVTSSGEAPATAVRLDDVLPPELTVVPGSVVSSAGTVLDESPVAIDFGTLDPGTEAVVTFDALVDSALPASVFEVANQGAVTSAELPAVLTDDPARVGTADATVTTLTPKPLLIAEKTVELAVDSNADGEASAGDTLGYRIRIFNDGNVPATSVSLSDPIPLATAIVTDSVATSAGAVTSEDPVTVAIGEVDPGEEVIVTFDVAIIDPLPSGVFEVSNQGLVTSAELPDLPTDDPTTSTSADPTITPLAGEPVLEAEKVALLVDDVGGDGEVSPGDGLLYQVTLTNAGGREATAIQFGDPIPDGTTIEPGSVQTSQGTVLGEDPVLVDLGTLDAGSEATVSFRVRIDAAVPPSGEVVNQGALESAELAPVPTDDPNTAEPDDPTRTPVADPPVLVVSDVSVLEAAGHVQFVVTLDRTTLADIEIGVTTTDGTALAGSDYVPLSGPVIIEAGADSALVEVAVSGDSLFESDEVFFLDVTQADGVVVADGRGAAQIVDDDPAPTLAVDDAEATEGDAGTTSASVTFELDAVSGLDASVAWSTAPGTAQSGVDYVEDSGVLTIPAGEIAGDVTVSVLGDEIDEGDESFSILLSGPENVSLASPSAGVSILDDDLAEISVADAELLEGAEGELPVAGVSVELSTAADREIQVRWTTAEDSAEAGVDYEPAEGTVAFEAGETAAELDIQVIGDDLLEDDEALRVELSDPVGSTIGYGVGLLTILDDELCVGPNLLVNPGAEAALEGDEIPAWTEVEGDEWMRWETLPEPAEGEASFYAGVAGPGGWAELIQEVDLTPYGERIDGGRQMFAFSGAVRTLDEVPPDVARIVVEYLDDTGQVLDLWDSGDLSSPLDWTFVSDTRVVPITTRRARVRLVSTLFAGDTVDGFFDALALTALRAPALTIGDVQVIEGDAEAAFVISLTCPWENEVTVTFATADGSAVAGEDYVATTGDLAIAAGETSATVTVPLLTDSVAEGEEYFELNLETATTGIDTEPVVVLDATGVCTLVEAGDCAPEPLGTVGEFNVFVFESVIQNATDVEGRLAAGTSAQLSNYSAGLQLADTGGDVLVVGTDLIFSGGTVHHGDVVVGGTAQLLGVDIVDGVLRQDSPIDFAAERAAIESLSAHLSTLPANGVTFVQPSKAIELEGTDLVLNVFGLMASDLSQASSVSIDVPVGSSVLINVDGASAVMQFFGFALSGAEPADVIYHFPDAISLVMQGIGVEGSVLAPQAHVQFNNGQLDGSLVARTLQGNGQANVGLFEGCLPLPDGETFCPRSPGYWKNHPGAWPVSELELGGTLYDQAGVQELLEYGGPDAASKLGRALSATELNIASGFQHPDLPPVLADAHAFLEVHPPGSNPKGAAKGQANALKDALEDFYSGASCDE